MSYPEESEHRKLARNLNELLQELRVAQAGVQILFGFLLSIAFTPRYTSVDTHVRVTHLVTVLFSAAAVALLTAPAAWHRMLFRTGRREDIVNMGSRFAIAGLVCLAVAMTGTVLMLAEVIIGGWAVVILGVGAAVVFGILWFAWPLAERARGRTTDGDDDLDDLEDDRDDDRKTGEPLPVD